MLTHALASRDARAPGVWLLVAVRVALRRRLRHLLLFIGERDAHFLQGDGVECAGHFQPFGLLVFA